MRPRIASLLLVACVAVLGYACRTPTQIQAYFYTDAPCPTVRGLAVTAGISGATERAPAQVESRQCSAGQLGDIYLSPGASGARASVRVVLGIEKDASTCTAANGYKGCIVARRSIAYQDHAVLRLPIALALQCLDVPCDEASTCARTGRCVPSDINERDCVNGECTLDETGGNGPDRDASVTQPDSGAPVDAASDAQSDGGPGDSDGGHPLAERCVGECGGLGIACCIPQAAPTTYRCAATCSASEFRIGCIDRSRCTMPPNDYCRIDYGPSASYCSDSTTQMNTSHFCTSASDCPSAAPSCSGLSPIPGVKVCL